MSKNFENQTELTTEQISSRAKEIYLSSGSVEGRDLENWLQAEKELRAESQKPQNSSLTSTAKINGAAIAKSSGSAATAKSAPISPTSVLAATSPIATTARTAPQRKGNKRESTSAR